MAKTSLTTMLETKAIEKARAVRSYKALFKETKSSQQKSVEKISDTKILIEPLKNNKSPLALYLINLSQENKGKLIFALLIQDKVILNDMLIVKLRSPEFKNEYKDISIDWLIHALNEPKDETRFLSTTTQEIIAILLSSESGMSRARILELATKKIPDEIIDPATKGLICKEIGIKVLGFEKKTITPEIESEVYNEIPLESTGYDEFSPPLAVNKYSGDITQAEYLTAIQSTDLDTSEFIILTLGVLQNTFKNENLRIDDSLMKIRHCYFNVDYQEALKNLLIFLKTHETSKHSNLMGKIKKRAQSEFKEIDSQKNHVRRFYETRLGQLHLGQLDLKSVSHVTNRIIGLPITNTDEIEPIANRFNYLYINDKKTEEHKQKARFKQLRNRERKQDFLTKYSESRGNASPQTVLSRNLGVLTSNSPNFPNELSIFNLKNRTVDIHFPQPRTNSASKQDVGYSSITRREAAFVSSLSGHAFAFAVLLEEYAWQYITDPDLEKDITNIIQMLASHYLTHGYHGLFEFLDAFCEPSVHDIFQSYNIGLNIQFPDAILLQASKDTQEYAKVLAIKKTLHQELRHNPPKLNTTRANSPAEKKDKKDTPVYLQKKASPSKVENATTTTASKTHSTEYGLEFYRAAYTGDINEIKRMLSQQDISIENIIRGWTALHAAINNNQVEAARLILEAKAIDINCIGPLNITPLYLAITNTHVDSVKLLLDMKADFPSPDVDYLDYAKKILEQLEIQSDLKKRRQDIIKIIRLLEDTLNKTQKKETSSSHMAVNQTLNQAVTTAKKEESVTEPAKTPASIQPPAQPGAAATPQDQSPTITLKKT